jgi:predicted dehydrogenase
MGQYHILALAELWDVELVAICDADPARAGEIATQYGTRAVATHQELAGLVDFATVAVPTERHFEITRDLLEPASTSSWRSR